MTQAALRVLETAIAEGRAFVPVLHRNRLVYDILMADKVNGCGPTPRQAELVEFIEGYQHDHGYAPSFVEMCKGIGCRSMSGIFQLLNGLEDRGIVQRTKFRGRSVRVL